MCNNFNYNKAIPAVFHNLNQKNPRLGFTIIRSDYFTVVYIDDLKKCHCFNFALRLTLTKSTKRKNKQKAEGKQTKSMKKKSENPVFFPNGKMLLNGLIQHIKHDQHLPVLFLSLLPSTNYLHVHC